MCQHLVVFHSSHPRYDVWVATALLRRSSVCVVFVYDTCLVDQGGWKWLVGIFAAGLCYVDGIRLWGGGLRADDRSTLFGSLTGFTCVVHTLSRCDVCGGLPVGMYIISDQRSTHSHSCVTLLSWWRTYEYDKEFSVENLSRGKVSLNLKVYQTISLSTTHKPFQRSVTGTTSL